MFPEIPIRLTTSKSACPTIGVPRRIIPARAPFAIRSPAVQPPSRRVSEEFRAHQSLPEDSEFHAVCQGLG